MLPLLEIALKSILRPNLNPHPQSLLHLHTIPVKQCTASIQVQATGQTTLSYSETNWLPLAFKTNSMHTH